MRNKKNSVRLLDIAKVTGVSPMTVSRFLNNPDLVAKKTRNTIEHAISKLNYVQSVVKSLNVKVCDIAKLTGLSPMTVSRAINSPDLVSDKTRTHVEKKILELRNEKKRINTALELHGSYFRFVFFDRLLNEKEVVKYIKFSYEGGIIPCVLPFETKTELLSNIAKIRELCNCDVVILSPNENINNSDLLVGVKIIHTMNDS